MNLSGDAIAALGLCVTLLGILLAFVRKQATNETEFKFRITALEKHGDGLSVAINKLTAAVTRLDRKLAVSNARASQGQFADTDRPPEE